MPIFLYFRFTLSCIKEFENHCENGSIIHSKACSNYANCIESQFLQPFDPNKPPTVQPKLVPTITETNSEATEENNNNLHFVWLICIPLVLMFGIGKYLYERKTTIY